MSTIEIAECTDPVPAVATAPGMQRQTPVESTTYYSAAGAISGDGRLIVFTDISIPSPELAHDRLTLSLLRPELVKRAGAKLDFSRAFTTPLILTKNDFPPSQNPPVDPATGLDLYNALALVSYPGVAENPYPSDVDGTANRSGEYSTYDLQVFAPKMYYAATVGGAISPTLQVARLRVVVRSPNTANAQIQSAIFTQKFQELQTTNPLTQLPEPLRGQEPTLTHDGRLMLIHGDGFNRGQAGLQIQFSYNDDPTNLRGWSYPRALSELYSIRGVKVAGVALGERYPLARLPLRKPDGQLFQAGEMVQGAYPWITPGGDGATYSTTVAGPVGNRTMRGSFTYVGAYSHWTEYHVDGPINKNRNLQMRIIYSSPGALGSVWEPFTNFALNPLSTTSLRPMLPMFDLSAGRFNAVAFEEDGHFLVNWPMNEMIRRSSEPPTEECRNCSAAVPTQTPDLSGNFNTGYLTGGASFPTEYTGAESEDENPGVNGRAIYFRGGSAITAFNSTSLTRPLDQFTLQIWVKPLVALSSEVTLVDWTSRANLAIGPGGLTVKIYSAGKSNSLALNTSLPVGSWSHLAVTFNLGQVAVYQDAVRIGGAKVSSAGLDQPAQSGLVVGAVGASGGTWQFLIDEFKLSDVVRTDGEIRQAAYLEPTTTSVASDSSPTLPLGLRAAELQFRFNATEEQLSLGKMLFFDPRLSSDRTVSCASCHMPNVGFASPHNLTAGLDGVLGARNVPTVVNRAFGKSHFWDGRVADLRELASIPLEAPHEMNNRACRVAAWLNQVPDYQKAFHAAFGEPATVSNLKQALALYQGNLFSANSRADRFLAGQTDALSAKEQQGWQLFQGKAGCIGCHRGSNFTDELFHITGVRNDPGDLGRGLSLPRKHARGSFKTPTLRDVALTAPYFHDGSASTLGEVVAFYNRGGDSSNRGAEYTSEIAPLALTEQEESALVAFLEALSGTSLNTTVPTLPSGPDPIYPRPVTTNAVASDPYADAIGKAYLVMLQRSPDANAALQLSRLMSGALTKAALLEEIYRSAEFRDRHSVPQRGTVAYIALLYQVLLGRLPAIPEVLDWYQPLVTGQMDRLAVFRGFIGSDEFARRYPSLK